MEAFAGDSDAGQPEHPNFGAYRDGYDDFDVFYLVQGPFDGTRGIGAQ